MTKEELENKQHVKIPLPDNSSQTRVFWNSFITDKKNQRMCCIAGFFYSQVGFKCTAQIKCFPVVFRLKVRHRLGSRPLINSLCFGDICHLSVQCSHFVTSDGKLHLQSRTQDKKQHKYKNKNAKTKTNYSVSCTYNMQNTMMQANSF